MRWKSLLIMLVVLGLLVAACAEDTDDVAEPDDVDAPADEPAPADGDYDIVLIQGLAGEEFYISMECGALEAAEELGVNLSVQGPTEFDHTLQTPIVNAVVADQPDAILIAPTDDTAMHAPLQEAVDAGIVVILVDTTLADPDLATSQIASDNYGGGETAAEALAELIDEEGKVMVVNVRPGITTTDLRQQGFEDRIAEFENIEYLGTEFSDNEPAQAAAVVTATLAAEPDLAGIFATNLASAEGSATGLRTEGAEEDVMMIGFDAGPAQVSQLQDGLVQALVTQKPREIGRLGVQQAVNELRGDPVEAVIETDFVVATPDNLEEPGIAEFLYTDAC